MQITELSIKQNGGKRETRIITKVVLFIVMVKNQYYKQEGISDLIYQKI